jgi:hypothetical protein
VRYRKGVEVRHGNLEALESTGREGYPHLFEKLADQLVLNPVDLLR